MKALALLAVVRRGGRGWMQPEGAKLAGFVIRQAGMPARAGSKAKRSGLAASGQGVT